eukprot:804400-Prymnesium_polylepis.1
MQLSRHPPTRPADVQPPGRGPRSVPAAGWLLPSPTAVRARAAATTRAHPARAAVPLDSRH